MNRRNFLSMMVGGVAAAAAVRTFPFRVFSFPQEVKPSNYWLGADYGFGDQTVLTRVAIMRAMEQMKDRIGRVSQETIYLHPDELKRWKSLAYIHEIVGTGHAEGIPPDMRGSYTLNGTRIVITPQVGRRVIQRSWAPYGKLVPNMPHFNPLLPTPLR